MLSELNLQANLTLSAGKSLGNRAKQRSCALLDLNRCGISIVEEIEELKHTLNSDVLTNDPGASDTQIHIDKRRCAERIAASLQVASIEIAIAILIDGILGTCRVTETALRTENIAELDLPRQLQESVHFEGVAKREIRGTVVERGSVVELSGYGDVIAVAGEEAGSSVSLARAGGSARVGHNRNYATEAVRGKAVAGRDSAGAEVGIEGIIVFGDKGIAPADGVAVAQTFFKREDATVIGAGVPRTEPVDLSEAASTIVDACREREIRFANTQNVDDVFVIVVERNHPILAELALYAEIIAACVRGGEAGINRDREAAGLKDVEG